MLIRIGENRMQYKDFENATAKQVEAVMLIIPEPEGKGLTYEKASKELGISIDSFKDRISNFKNNCPEAWDEIESCKNAVQRQGKGLERPFDFEEEILNKYIDKIHDGSVEPDWELVAKMQEEAMRLNVIKSGMTSINDKDAFDMNIAIDENKIKHIF